MQNSQFDWVYVCGLGEPTFNGNYEKFMLILELCKKYGLRCSTFSNLSHINSELISFIECGVLHILFKYDSNDPDRIRTLYGMNNANNIKEQLNNIKKVAQYVRVENGATNFAASIVPTQLNRKDIGLIVEECLNAGIFPLLGELELSGKGQLNYENLGLNKAELSDVKEDVDRICGGEYIIPVCPSVISGIHFSYDSNITVDEFSGLSCHWFWLNEPKTKTLLHFDNSVEIESIKAVINEYRHNRLTYVENYYKNNNDVGLAFGGCGGSIHQIFKQYLNNHRRWLQ